MSVAWYTAVSATSYTITSTMSVVYMVMKIMLMVYNHTTEVAGVIAYCATVIVELMVSHPTLMCMHTMPLGGCITYS